MPMPTFCRVQAMAAQVTEPSLLTLMHAFILSHCEPPSSNCQAWDLLGGRGRMLAPLPPSKEGVVRILE